MEDEGVDDPNDEENDQKDLLSTMTQRVFTLFSRVGIVVMQV